VNLSEVHAQPLQVANGVPRLLCVRDAAAVEETDGASSRIGSEDKISGPTVARELTRSRRGKMKSAARPVV
jgi:hypothetical protein